MSDHLIAEAHRHAMALPTTHPTHADIAWYVREVSGLRAELALLREWQREVIQNANAHHAERKDAIARAESAEREAFDWKKIARYEAARAERAEAESIQLKKTNVENADSYRLMQGRVIAAEVEVERLKARLYQGCDDERDMAISEGPGHSTCGLADELTARAERAEAELAFQVARNSDLFTQRDQIRAELDAERARLDWLEENAKDIMKYNCRSYIWFAHQNIRAAIDAATTEDAK